ncbi:MAG: 16S rRNA (guanine(527)-N(7))-methyltransferase RsmG [Chloroflexi bacterium]|nr:16S rRNA (guanine(527)-N(7))-methyltransferase RsmG [Chloroflexota bacterium]
MTFRDGTTALGLMLNRRQHDAFARYRDAILDWTATQSNLTAVRSAEEIDRWLFLESLTLVRSIAREGRSRLLDVGTGAGIPGLALKLAVPDRLDVTLLEATGKKAQFLQSIVEALGDQAQGVQVVNARAESLAQDPRHRGTYDYVTARALAPLSVIVELALPFARVGGFLLAPKGRDVEDEVRKAQRALAEVGGRIHSIVKEDRLPSTHQGLHTVVIEKISDTPARYPRRTGIPAKRPL